MYLVAILYNLPSFNIVFIVNYTSMYCRNFNNADDSLKNLREKIINPPTHCQNQNNRLQKTTPTNILLKD